MKKLFMIVMALVLCLTVFAACSKENEGLQAAADYVFQLYKDDAEATPTDYDVVAQVTVDEKVYTVTWTVDVTEGVTVKESAKAGFWTIDVNEKTATEIAYKLTATIADEDGNTLTKEFSHKVPAYKVNTYAEYAAAADDAPVVVKGVITGIMAKSDGDKENNVFLQDLNNEGGYYLYNMEKDPITDLGLKVGMTVEAIGIKATYYGTHEVKNVSIEIVDSTIKTVTPVDYTELFTAAEKNDEAALSAKQSMLVTIKGVEVTGQDIGNGYFKFKLDGVETYVRISGTSNCTTAAESDAFKATHTAKQGYFADVTGIVQQYNGVFYLIPVSADAFSNFSLPVKTPDQQIAHELAKLAIKGLYTENGELVLPVQGADYPDVVFAYTVTNMGTATTPLTYDATTGKLTVTVGDAYGMGMVTVVANVEGATAPVTKNYEIMAIKVVDAESAYIAAFYAESKQVIGKYTYTGVITSVDTAYSSSYKNITVTIAIGNLPEPQLQCYRLAYTLAEGETVDKCAGLKVGDIITVEGEILNYNGKLQLNQGCQLKSVVTSTEAATNAFAVTTGNTLTTALMGTVQSIEGNAVTLKVGESNTITLTLGDVEDLLVDDVLIVYGVVNNTDGTFTMTAATTNLAGPGLHVLYHASSLDSPEEIVDAAYDLEAGESLNGQFTLSGIITSIDIPYDDGYKNITVTIVVAGLADQPIKCFRLKGDGAATLAVGDNITVTGVIKNYNGTVEFDAGCTLDAVKTQAQIVDDLYALEQDKALAEKYTLTGVVTEINEAYSTQYKNITVTIKVADKADKLVKCFRLKGTGADAIAVGDTITVYGELKNYGGTFEFNSGCIIVAETPEDEGGEGGETG
ncbi:MAG: hypothetical protein IJY50_05210, partial [Clostridia bacterium]|nr:hypothetical protein [Clostridia bacterium]